MSYFRGGVEDMLLGSRGQVARLALGVKVEHEVLQGGLECILASDLAS